MEEPIFPQPQHIPLQKPPGYMDRKPPRAAADSHRRPPPLPPAFRDDRRQCGCCPCCCCCLLFLFLLLLSVGFAVLAFSGVICFYYRPSLPDFHLLSMRIKQLEVVVGPNRSTIRSHITAKVQVNNKNEKVELHYGPTQFRVTAVAGSAASLKVIGLGVSTVPGFVQSRENVTVLFFDAKSRDMAVDNSIGKVVKNGVASAKLALGVEVRTAVGITAGKMKSGRIGLLVSCGPATLKQLNNGQTPKCRINIFDLISFT